MTYTDEELRILAGLPQLIGAAVHLPLEAVPLEQAKNSLPVPPLCLRA